MGIYEGLKDAGKVLKEANKIEQYKQILEAQEKMLEMQKRITDLESENTSLKDKLGLQENLVYENNAYWILGERKDGPFCSRCWEADKKTVHMKAGVNNSSFATCPNCKHVVQTNPHFRPAFTSRKVPPNHL